MHEPRLGTEFEDEGVVHAVLSPRPYVETVEVEVEEEEGEGTGRPRWQGDTGDRYIDTHMHRETHIQIHRYTNTSINRQMHTHLHRYTDK